MKLVALLFAASLAFAQQAVTITDDPPLTADQYVFGYTGTNLIYQCIAKSIVTTGLRASTTVAISTISKANPAVVTSAGHGFSISSRPSVTIGGATGTGWTAVNATFSVTVIDANTFSLYSPAGVALDSTGFGTLAGTVIFSTTAPRTTMYEWAVKKLVYDGSNNLIWIGWLAGSTFMQARCSDATSTTIQQQ